MPRQWTPEEIASLPQTQTVFDKPKLVFNAHKWVQQGNMVTDICSPSTPACEHVGIPIPYGKMLVKTKEGYDLVDEADDSLRVRR